MRRVAARDLVTVPNDGIRDRRSLHPGGMH